MSKRTNSFARLRGALLATSACAAFVSTAGIATAQDSSTGKVEKVTVTGSRIPRPNLSSQIPITSIGGDEFVKNSNANVGDALNQLPQLRSTFAQQNPALGVGIAGLNLLDLRGLGTVRTLVLVNGRRHVGADITSSAVTPDINTIPNDLIERVDIVTGGNSAVYGSDAIAGVVNFVLRKRFEGYQVRANAGVSDEGFGDNNYVSAMYGLNFDEDRGNVTVHAEHAEQDRVFASDIPALRIQNGLLVVDVDPAGLPAGSDGFPDRMFFRDIRSASINRFGLIPITQPVGAPCGMGIGSTNGAPSTVGGLPYNCTFVFDPTGNLSAQTGTRLGQGIIGGIIGGNGQTTREDQLVSVLPQQERYNFNLLSHYRFADWAEAFLEAKFVTIDTIGSNAGPSFIQGTFTQFDIRERVRIDNPFLTPAQRTTIANAILLSGCNTSLTAACVTTAGAPAARTTAGAGPTLQGVAGPLNAADTLAINNGTYRFVVSRNLADSGIRDEEFQRDTLRVAGGLRGDFNEDWSYEVSLNYGEFDEETTTFGYLDRQRFVLSLDAGRNPVTNAIECRAKFDAAAAVALTNPARLAADIAACVPYNPFGAGDNSAAAKYFVYNATHNAAMSQFVASGFVSGDLSQLFELQGGPIAFALGGEYRKETTEYNQDPFVQTGATNAVVIPTFAPPNLDLAEIFGEVRVPVLADLPYAEELTFAVAGRASRYNNEVGSVGTYNYGVIYAPVDDVRFRVNFGRSVRAPNVSETGFPLVPNFAPGFLDPCAAGQIGANPNRQPNCLAQLGAAVLAGLPNVAYSLPVVSGSNPLLNSEKSDSWTYGAVIQPRFMPGFAASVDYYDIKVADVIVSLPAQNIANLCYDQPSLANQFCGLFTRYLGPTPGPLGEQTGQILGNSLIQAGVNFAKRVRRGLDTQVSYRTDLGDDWGLSTQLIYTHNFQISNFNNPTLPNFEDRILSELGDPQDEFRWDLDVSAGPLTFGYRLSFIGPMYVSLYEDFQPLPDACTAAGCPPNNLDFADVRRYPAITYHDFRVQYDVDDIGSSGEDLQLYAGVDNVFDTYPPLGLNGLGTAGTAGSAIYDIRGRAFYAGAKLRF